MNMHVIGPADAAPAHAPSHDTSVPDPEAWMMTVAPAGMAHSQAATGFWTCVHVKPGGEVTVRDPAVGAPVT